MTSVVFALRNLLRRFPLAILIWFVFAVSIGADFAFADDRLRQSLLTNIQRQESALATLDRNVFFALCLALSVGILGALGAAIQSFQGRWVKAATVTVTTAVAVISVIRTTIYECDHFTLRAHSHAAHEILDKIQANMDEPFPENTDDQKTFVASIKGNLETMKHLCTTECKGADSPGVAEAQAAQSASTPSWLTKLPSEPDQTYFIGIGEDGSLSAAEAESLEDAKKQVREFLASRFGSVPGEQSTKIAELAHYVADSASRIDRYYAFDSGSYRYYTLLRVDRQLASIDIASFAAQKRTESSQDFGSSLSGDTSKVEAYQQRRQKLYIENLEAAKKSLPSPDYQKFVDGREARRKNDLATAEANLKEVTERNPDFYMGWFNLALTYSDLGKNEEARAAYERAVKFANGRDSSLCNSYGAFLYSQQDWDGAKQQFCKALEIDPGNSKAVVNLQVLPSNVRGSAQQPCGGK